MRFLLPALLGLSGTAYAQDTIDLGVLQNSDIHVVQKLLYPKAGRTELGMYLGWMPFDAFTTTPMAGVSFASFASESFGYEAYVGGGYGMKNSTYKDLESPLYSVAPDAYRYLASAKVQALWSPIYAKMNVMGGTVIHHDVYGLAGAGATVEQALLPDHSIAIAPTIALGVGARAFLGGQSALRLQLVDDVLVEYRTKTETTHIKHNVGLSVGLTLLSKVEK